MELLQIVRQALQESDRINPGQRLAAALSGGRDSVCLLHALKELESELGYRLSAVHVHHGLRAEADQDESFCRSLCRRWQIPLTVYRVDVPGRVQTTGESIEEAARNLRYQAFERLPADRIALAHHQQDQAETVLLHLLRGSGLTGLSGMRALRPPYIRPMLQASEREIETYRQAHQLAYAEDASNQDTAFRRNRIRHELLPNLQQFYNPEIVKGLARMAESLQCDVDFIESQVPALPENSETLSISELLAYPESIRRRMLRNWLVQAGLTQDISQRHIQQLLELAEGATGRRVNLPKGLTVTRSYDILRICKRVPNAQTMSDFPRFEMEFLSVSQVGGQFMSPQHIPALPDEKWLDAGKLTETPIWRIRQPGDYIIASGGKKKLKEFMIDQKIPREERAQVPLLADGAHILWVYGYRLSDGVKITENTQRVLHIRRI